MSDATLHATEQNPDDFAVQIADQIESFLVAVTEVAKGDEPDSAVPFLLLEVSQLLLAGGRLGAHEDIVPEARYEPDMGPEPDVDELRENLARLLDPIDVYSEVFDPYEPRKAPVPARISDDLTDVITDLRHGMAHYKAGRTSEALWWWQFSYFSNWGSTASAAPARPPVGRRARPPEPAPRRARRPRHRPGHGRRDPGGRGRQGHGRGDRQPPGHAPAHLTEGEGLSTGEILVDAEQHGHQRQQPQRNDDERRFRPLSSGPVPGESDDGPGKPRTHQHPPRVTAPDDVERDERRHDEHRGRCPEMPQGSARSQ